MDKVKYYEKLHNDLSIQFNISVEAIETIRSFALGPQKLTRGQIILWVKKRIENAGISIQHRNEPIHNCPNCKHLKKVEYKVQSTTTKKFKKLQEIYLFMQRADEQAWKDMTFGKFNEKN